MTTPLSIIALYHSENKEGDELFSRLYSLLCRDVKNPFSDGLDIPVYFVKGNDKSILSLPKTSSKKKVILVFIDINMFCADNWRQFVASLNQDDNTLIVGVKQYKHAFSFNKALGDIQSIVVDSSEIDSIPLLKDENWSKFTTLLYDLLIRFVKGKTAKPLSVFISHTKRDKGNFGELSAKDVRNFLASDTKLNSFFDVHDILDGYDFESQIKDSISNSALLILFTDMYSTREWCRIEAITAKKKMIPTVVVSMIKNGVDRIFPYIGNVPCIGYNGDWRLVINLLLRTILDQTIEKQTLEQEKNDSTLCLPYPPEAFNVSMFDDKTTKVLYPEPPLGNEELEILKNIATNVIRKDIQFQTPMEFNTDKIDLNKKYVGISVSENEGIPATGISREMFIDLQIELVRHILKSNGRLIYGGDLRKGGFTELFRDLAKQYGQQEKSELDVCYVEDYLSWPLYNEVTIEQKTEYLASRIKLMNASPGSFVEDKEKGLFLPPTNHDNKLKWASSLRVMRETVIDKSIARVVAGGKIHNFKGYMPGVAEEVEISIKEKKPLFLIGGFGGVTQVITQIIEKKATSESLLDKAEEDDEYKAFYNTCREEGHCIDYKAFDDMKLEDFRTNGLSDDENKKLFHSIDIIEIVSLILKGLENISKAN